MVHVFPATAGFSGAPLVCIPTGIKDNDPCAAPFLSYSARLPTTDEGEGENMDAATVAQLGSGEPTVMHGEADTVQATKQGARGGEDADPHPHRARGQ